ncbi:class I SAM-dependent methyltransferase [Methylocystis sp. JAN1]|uniref:class I SAM-dependent methyltransferase n=1 Tax=Methylocystis sp. JAN1 TaxID=3397211 RepID=UPI003FA2802A
MDDLYEKPWPMVEQKACYWYHSMEFPDGTRVEGSWDIPDFANYVGYYDLRGKTVLDIGTATGYLAFNAEKAGATVTALDAASTREFRHVPFMHAQSFMDIKTAREDWTQKNLIPVKNSWWYCWHKYKSNAKCVYTPIPELYEWDTSFDVVLAGAIIEHLSDPVYSIGAWCKVAKEAVIIPFTDVIETEDLVMRPITSWTDPNFNYAWWTLSKGLYDRIFDNCGFDVEYVISRARHNHDPSGPSDAQRPTILAKRRK